MSEHSVLTFEQVREQLETVLESDLNITGNYFSQESYKLQSSWGCDPSLCIEGVGTIQLPLDQEQAARIIDVASQAPYGHGEETIVDTRVRDTWQIEPAKVKFQYSSWDYRLEEYAKEVCRQMGIAYTYQTQPECQFHKLLLYETGSHFLPHQDSEKAKGMFASMIIILPSSYTGGQVHLKLGSRTDIIDVASTAANHSVVLGWYTDVVHEVKPITSGFRLALSYNLIRRSSESPHSYIRIHDSAISKLRTVLSSWKAAKFGPERKSNLLAYIFKHQYSRSNLSSGAGALKGRDAPLAWCLQELADELGFLVIMGQITYHILGTGRNEPNLSEGEDEDDKPADFYNIWEREVAIEHLAGLDGTLIDMTESYDLNGNGILIPRSYLKTEEPDETDFEAYTGNDGNNVEYWYKRTALILVPEEDAIDNLYRYSGANFALWALTSSKVQPSESVRELAFNGLGYLYELRHQPWNRAAKGREETLQKFADQALRWVDLEIWAETIFSGEQSIELFGQQRLYDAMKTFGFEGVRPIFEDILTTKQSLENRLTFIYSLPTFAKLSEQIAVAAWCQNQPMLVLLALPILTVEDVVAIVSFAKEKGPMFLRETVLPQARNMKLAYDVASRLMTTVWRNKSIILNDRLSEGNVFDAVISECANLAIRRFEAELDAEMSRHSYDRKYGTGKRQYLPPSTAESQINRSITLLEFCTSANCKESCETLFQTLYRLEAAPGRFETIILPVSNQACVLLRSKGIQSDAPPFSEFFKSVIDDYFRHLPPLPSDDQLVRIRNVGCGCIDCISLDDFIRDPVLEKKDFELTFLRRHHIETQLANAENLVVFETIREAFKNPHGLRVEKVPATILTQQWQVRLSDARSFLQGIGTEEVIRRILGDGYQQVQQTLTNIAQATGPGASVESQEGTPATTSVGQKRKREDGLDETDAQ